MSSVARLEANRENAKKSTGPKSKRGKLRSRQNARKHNIFSQKKLLPPGDQKKLQRLRRQLFAERKPKGICEILCVNELALTIFRRTRIPRWETAVISENVRHAREDFENIEDFDDEFDHEADAPKFTKVAATAASMVRQRQVALITGYERSLDKKEERLFARLEQLQRKRKAKQRKLKDRKSGNTTESTNTTGTQ